MDPKMKKYNQCSEIYIKAEDMQKENRGTKGHKCVLIMENYKNVELNQVSGVLWEQSHEENHKIETHFLSQLHCQSASPAILSNLLPLSRVGQSAFTFLVTKLQPHNQN